MKNLYKILILLAFLSFGFTLFFYSKTSTKFTSKVEEPVFQIRSVDTVKYSRDLAREKINSSTFDLTIDSQVREIKELGTTHVALGTPYDSEFKPYLKKWVIAARRYGLKVWFRGNFSGWEQWFDYPSIDRPAHIAATEKFILDNPDLFEDEDIFTSCPECENGGSGDPRQTGDIAGFRAFLIDEYKISNSAFTKINKLVKVGYYSMNYDVAKLIMDPATTASLGGIVAIDHYVAFPDQLITDTKKIASSSGGKVVLGEFGAPIPDLNGNMTEAEQADWIKNVLQGLSTVPEVIGVNYWVGVGGSTQIWDDNGNPKKAVDIIKKYYSLTRSI